MGFGEIEPAVVKLWVQESGCDLYVWGAGHGVGVRDRGDQRGSDAVNEHITATQLMRLYLDRHSALPSVMRLCRQLAVLSGDVQHVADLSDRAAHLFGDLSVLFALVPQLHGNLPSFPGAAFEVLARFGDDPSDGAF